MRCEKVKWMAKTTYNNSNKITLELDSTEGKES